MTKLRLLTHKSCSKCGEFKPLTSFCKNNKTKSGYASICKQCRRLYASDNREHINKINKENRDVDRRRASTTLRNHLYNGISSDCSIDEMAEKFKSTQVCPICGVKLTQTMGNGHDFNAPSLDRINNDNIITLENTWVICHRCNTIKGDMTMKEFVKYCDNVSLKFKEMV